MKYQLINLILIGLILVLQNTNLQQPNNVTAIPSDDTEYLQWQQAVEGDVMDVIHYQEASGREAFLVAIRVDSYTSRLRSYDAENGSLLWNYQVTNASVRFNYLYKAQLFSNDSTYLFAYGYQYSEPIPGYEEASHKGTYYLFNLETKALIQTFFTGSYIDIIRIGYLQSTDQPKLITVSDRLVNLINMSHHEEILVMDIPSQTVIWNHTFTNWNTTYSNQIGNIYSVELQDLTHDGYDEIIVTKSLKINVSAKFSSIEVYDGATFELLWNNINQEIRYPSEMEFHDITGDDTLDIVCNGAGRGTYAVNGATGETLWSLSEVGSNCCAIEDIDQDGDIEVITYHLENLSIINSKTGNLEYTTLTPFAHNCLDINVTDINYDGKMEIISSSFYGNIYIFNATGSVLIELPTFGPAFSMLILDINHDNITEIVAGTMTTNGILSVFQIPNASGNNQSIPVNISMLILPLVITFVCIRFLNKKLK